MTAAPLPRANRTHRLVQDNPPPTPACFSTRQSWQEWLQQAIDAGEPLTRLQDTGKYAGKRLLILVFEPRIDFCQDCTREHRYRMRRLGRCTPVPDLEPAQVADRPREPVAATL